MSNYVGNDIVDITNNEVLEKFQDDRFLRRVLSTVEFGYLSDSSTPELVLWFLWSAKEAAYKALKKYDKDTIFSHRKFEVSIDDIKSIVIGERTTATLTFKCFNFDLEWSSSNEWIHCNAVMAGLNNKAFDIFDYKVMKTFEIIDRSHIFSEQEKLSIYSEQSKAVRVLAKALLYQNGLEQVQIVRLPAGKRFFPPKIFRYSKELPEWDISMSHDGGFVACLVTKS